MANLKISQLTDGGPLQASDEIPVERAGTNVKVAGSEFGGSQPFNGGAITDPLIIQPDDQTADALDTEYATVSSGVNAPAQLPLGVLLWTAKPTGKPLVLGIVNDGASQPLSFTVEDPLATPTSTEYGVRLTVHLATDGGGVASSTAADVVAGVPSSDFDPYASVALFPGEDGTTLITISDPDLWSADSHLAGHARVKAGGYVDILDGRFVGDSLKVTRTSGDGLSPFANILNAACDGYGMIVRAFDGCLLLSSKDTNPILQVWTNDSGTLALQIGGGNPAEIDLPALPVADPHVAGRLWNSAGTLKVSAG